jgi:uncharacterized protein YcaQ
MKQVDSKRAIETLLEEGRLIECRIEGVKDRAYLSAGLKPLAQKAQKGKLTATHTTLLSMFDPLVWDRRRLRELFDFDYTIEVYTPQEKRKFGYFVLPILCRGRLVGRLCPKAHRKEGVFEVRAFHLEPGVQLSEADWDSIAAAIRDCAVWHSTPQLKLTGGDRNVQRALKPRM